MARLPMRSISPCGLAPGTYVGNHDVLASLKLEALVATIRQTPTDRRWQHRDPAPQKRVLAVTRKRCEKS